MDIYRGEIYFVDLGPPRGSEQAGIRPAMVLSINMINRLPLVVTVVPGTSAKPDAKDFPTQVRVPSNASGLPLETIFKCFQITVVDRRKFSGAPAGRISPEYLRRIEDAARFVLGLER